MPKPCSYTAEDKKRYTQYITDSIVWWLRDKSPETILDYINRKVDVASILISTYPSYMVAFGRSLVGKRGVAYLSSLNNDDVYATIDNILAARPDVGLVFWANKEWYINIITRLLDQFVGEKVG